MVKMRSGHHNGKDMDSEVMTDDALFGCDCESEKLRNVKIAF